MVACQRCEEMREIRVSIGLSQDASQRGGA